MAKREGSYVLRLIGGTVAVLAVIVGTFIAIFATFYTTVRAVLGLAPPITWLYGLLVVLLGYVVMRLGEDYLRKAALARGWAILALKLTFALLALVACAMFGGVVLMP
jgi:xanthosine utilization system XapX-like protein